MDIYSLFPLLIPQNKSKTVYKGFIEIYVSKFAGPNMRYAFQ